MRMSSFSTRIPLNSCLKFNSFKCLNTVVDFSSVEIIFTKHSMSSSKLQCLVTQHAVCSGNLSGSFAEKNALRSRKSSYPSFKRLNNSNEDSKSNLYSLGNTIIRFGTSIVHVSFSFSRFERFGMTQAI